jgi:tRNA G18 (ribose-2'-O)-methylase SpoU
MRGYFGIGIYRGKTADNIGGLWRSAHSFGANWIFTIGKRYKTQATDTMKSDRHVPLWEWDDLASFKAALPRNCALIGVEICPDAITLPKFEHPERAVYLLGSEDSGLPPDVMAECVFVISIPSERCLNVATAGSIVLYDRRAKRYAD